MGAWDYNFSLNYDVLCDRAISAYKTEMYAQHAATADSLQDLRLVVGPGATRKVLVAGHFAKGALVLIAVTPSVCITKGNVKDNKVPPSSIDCGLAFKHPRTSVECRLYLNSKTQKMDTASDASGFSAKKPVDEFMAPFWLVGTTQDEKQVNCTLSMRSSKVGDYTFLFPTITNTKVVKDDAELLYYRSATAARWACEPAAPAAKRAKVS